MKRLICIVLIFNFCLLVKAQETEFGLVFGGNLFQHISWDRSVYEAPNWYHTYVESEVGKGFLNKNAGLNGIHFGLIAR